MIHFDRGASHTTAQTVRNHLHHRRKLCSFHDVRQNVLPLCGTENVSQKTTPGQKNIRGMKRKYARH